MLFLVCFTQFPDALRPAFPRLKDRLDDPDTGKLANIMEGGVVFANDCFLKQPVHLK